ncbi:MAG: FkbM family methyltransferase, partial [Planctomycetota bacterium]
DVLKIDIEGSEYDVLPSLLDVFRTQPPEQFLIEFHHRWHHDGAPKPSDTKAALHSLKNAGFRIAHVAPGGCEYTFVHADLLD